MKIVLFSLALIFSAQAETLKEKLDIRSQASSKKMPDEIKAVMKKGLQDLKDSGIEKRTLKVGKTLPSFSLKDARGIITPIKNIYSKGPLVITFYRGHWCTYCQLELKEYEILKSEFEKAGATIIALAPDKWNLIKKTKEKLNLSFDIFRDENNNIAKRMGLAFALDSDTLRIYKKFGINLEESQGNSNNELPMPGTYVVDRLGIVRFSYADPDYKKRAEPSEVLKVVQSLK